MKTRFSFVLIGLCCCIWHIPLFAQPADTQGWLSGEVTLKFSKKLATEVKYQARLDENISQLKGHYNTISVAYKPISWLTLSPEYRFVKNNSGNSKRAAFELKGKWKWGDAALSVAPKYMYETKPQADDIEAFHELEPEFELSYALNKRHSLYLNSEVLFDLQNNFFRERIRASGGYEINWTKTFASDLFFKSQWTEKKAGTEQVYILGLGLKYKLNLK